VEQVENSSNQISLVDAQRANPGAQVGDTIADTLPPLEYGRIAAQSAKQVIVQKVREAERDRQYQEFKDRIGDIVNGVVKRVEYGSVIVDLGRGEAIVRRDEMLPREVFRNGDRVRAYIFDVRRETRGPQIFLSRTHPQFMAKLFAQEVPEIYDGIVEIKAVARDPGSRAKIGVVSRDSSVDPVGACVARPTSRTRPASSWKRSMSTRSSASCWPRKASPRSRNWRWSMCASSPASKALTKRPPTSCRTAPRSISSSRKPSSRAAARSSA